MIDFKSDAYAQCKTARSDNGNMKIYCRRCDQTFRLYSYRDSVEKFQIANGQVEYAKFIDCPWCDKKDRLMFFEKEYA